MLQHLHQSQWRNWERFYRTNFINSLSGFKSAALIGTINQAGVTNLAIFSNIVHLGADPSLIGFINRPKAAAPHTIQNIEQNKVYTINSIPAGMIEKAHQTSAKYNDNISEFDAVGLTPHFLPSVLAPFVEESPVKYALELVEIVPITHNNTFLVIGTITDVLVPSQLIASDGFIELHKADVVTTLGIDAYFGTQPLGRFSYAKPNQPLSTI